MINSPLVSVIIPTHNRPDLLKRTLESITHQTYKNLEIIVVSNGINEKNRKTVEAFRSQKMLYVDQKNSGGPASPRNNGMRIAKGKYLAFCDDDDVWFPNKLKKQIDFLENHREYIGCYSGMLRFDNEKEWIIDYENGVATFESLLRYNCVPISSLIVRKSCLKEVGFFEESSWVGTAEDYEYLLRILSKFKLYYIREILIKYWSGENRQTQHTVTIKSSSKYLKSVLYSYWAVCRKMRISPLRFVGPILYQILQFFRALRYAIKTRLESL